MACELCARICPCDCIEVVPYEDEKGNRHPAKFEIDTARCLFCGLCEDACPADAIALGQQYEFSSFSSRDLVIGRDDLLGKPGKADDRRRRGCRAPEYEEGRARRDERDAGLQLVAEYPANVNVRQLSNRSAQTGGSDACRRNHEEQGCRCHRGHSAIRRWWKS